MVARSNGDLRVHRSGCGCFLSSVLWVLRWRWRVCAQVGQLALDSHKRRTLIDRGLLEPVATLAMEAAHPSTRAAAAVALAALVATREDARVALTVGFHPPCAQLPLLTALVQAEAHKGEQAAAATAALAALSRADVACAGFVAEHRGLARVVSMLHAAGRLPVPASRSAPWCAVG
jgi:hypothetical protein